MQEEVVLVDRVDTIIGRMEKIEAHRKGVLHRAFSVFIFNSKGELLLQKRAAEKYHSPGLWSNTCCGHPRPGEKILSAATRRLYEEMGMDCSLDYVFKFTYFAHLSENMTEHEIDAVFFGLSDLLPVINPEEAAGYRYMRMEELEQDLSSTPEYYTKWLQICFSKVFASYKLYTL